MAIPENQLEIWSHQGSIAQSASTYDAVKTALEDSGTPYFARSFDVFLQGSYGNDTNIYSESDVDVVICYNGAFFSDVSSLTQDQRSAYDCAFVDGTYRYDRFKSDVLQGLETRFGNAVHPGPKAIKIAPEGNRRSADVIVAFEYRRYFQFCSLSNQCYTPGICFFQSDGLQIANYPKLHSANLTTKHQATGGMLKPTIRILKNIRSRLEANGLLAEGSAPSYFLEGLLYNVPNGFFGPTYTDTIIAAFNWIMGADRSQFLCANEEYYLLRESPVTWSAAKCEQFLSALRSFWRSW